MSLRYYDGISRNPGDWHALLDALIERDGDDCPLCDKPLSYSGRKIVVDHIEPRHRTKDDSFRNLQAVHQGCNAWKSGRNMDELRPNLEAARESRRRRREEAEARRMTYEEAFPHMPL